MEQEVKLCDEVGTVRLLTKCGLVEFRECVSCCMAGDFL